MNQHSLNRSLVVHAFMQTYMDYDSNRKAKASRKTRRNSCIPTSTKTTRCSRWQELDFQKKNRCESHNPCGNLLINTVRQPFVSGASCSRAARTITSHRGSTPISIVISSQKTLSRKEKVSTSTLSGWPMMVRISFLLTWKCWQIIQRESLISTDAEYNNLVVGLLSIISAWAMAWTPISDITTSSTSKTNQVYLHWRSQLRSQVVPSLLRQGKAFRKRKLTRIHHMHNSLLSHLCENSYLLIQPLFDS